MKTNYFLQNVSSIIDESLFHLNLKIFEFLTSKKKTKKHQTTKKIFSEKERKRRVRYFRSHVSNKKTSGITDE
jgi:hypothetical protein